MATDFLTDPGDVMLSHDDRTRQAPQLRQAALVLAAGALLVSAGNAGVPAIAGAMAGNADTVDGFHAVKAGTSVKHRKGKLVATLSPAA